MTQRTARSLRGMRPIAGLGPHGELPVSADQLQIPAQIAALARARRYLIVVVLHTATSDWSKRQIAGIRSTLEALDARVLVVDCGFAVDRQVAELARLVADAPDAIISIPVDTVQTADAYRRLAVAGITLVLMDNAPVGLLPRKDYATVVSADNFGIGQVAAELLSDVLPRRGSVGVVGFGCDFFVTNERELGFRKWIREHRPDVSLRHIVFPEPSLAGTAVANFLASGESVDAMFVAWDDPAMQVVDVLRGLGRELPITTTDLGSGVALEIARGGLIKGVGAQQPYQQGVAEATAAIMALGGEAPPTWVALPPLAVTRENLIEGYEAAWHEPAPEVLRETLLGRA
jgi:ribose transport system substrate-binding protein